MPIDPRFMSQARFDDLIRLLHRAFNAELGLAVTDPPNTAESLRAELYRARKYADDTDLECLSMTIVGDEVWIIKKLAVKMHGG